MLGSGPDPLPDPPPLLDGRRYMEPPMPRLLGSGGDRTLEDLARLFPRAVMDPRARREPDAATSTGDDSDGVPSLSPASATVTDDGPTSVAPPGPAVLVTDAARRTAADSGSGS